MNWQIQNWPTPEIYISDMAFNPKTFIVPPDNLSTQYVVFHGLGKSPNYLRVTVVCETADTNLAMQPGDEIEAYCFHEADLNLQLFSVYANSENIYICVANPLVSNEINSKVSMSEDGSNSDVNPVSWSNFNIKIYAL
jgi:hypothetical protein